MKEILNISNLRNLELYLMKILFFYNSYKIKIKIYYKNKLQWVSSYFECNLIHSPYTSIQSILI